MHRLFSSSLRAIPAAAHTVHTGTAALRTSCFTPHASTATRLHSISTPIINRFLHTTPFPQSSHQTHAVRFSTLASDGSSTEPPIRPVSEQIVIPITRPLPNGGQTHIPFQPLPPIQPHTAGSGTKAGKEDEHPHEQRSKRRMYILAGVTGFFFLLSWFGQEAAISTIYLTSLDNKRRLDRLSQELLDTNVQLRTEILELRNFITQMTGKPAPVGSVSFSQPTDNGLKYNRNNPTPSHSISSPASSEPVLPAGSYVGAPVELHKRDNSNANESKSFSM